MIIRGHPAGSFCLENSLRQLLSRAFAVRLFRLARLPHPPTRAVGSPFAHRLALGSPTGWIRLRQPLAVSAVGTRCLARSLAGDDLRLAQAVAARSTVPSRCPLAVNPPRGLSGLPFAHSITGAAPAPPGFGLGRAPCLDHSGTSAHSAPTPGS